MQQFTSRDPVTDLLLHYIYLLTTSIRSVWGASTGSTITMTNGDIHFVMQAPSLVLATPGVNVPLMLGNRNNGAHDGQLCLSPTGITAIVGQSVGCNIHYEDGAMFEVMESPGAVHGLLYPIPPST